MLHPPITEGVDDPLVCDEHAEWPKWYESGNCESGPGEPYLCCPACVREQQPQCPCCGLYEDQGYEVRSVWTRQYGGGYDSFYSCPVCLYTDVAT